MNNLRRFYKIGTSKEKAVSKQEKVKLNHDECRLIVGLNIHCLSEIFNYLDTYSLIQLCELDEYFQKIIVDHVIGNICINFTKLQPVWTTDKIFRTFGKKMRKFIIAEENTLNSFIHFLKFIIRYCEPNKLHTIEMRFRKPHASYELMREALPYLQNVRTLKINDGSNSSSFQRFLNVLGKSNNLEHLTLDIGSISGVWLNPNQMNNLQTLRIMGTKRYHLDINFQKFNEFLTTKTNLKKFYYSGFVNIEPITETLAINCTNLEEFIDYHLIIPYANERLITSLKRYQTIRHFKCLKCIGLTSYTDCGSDIFYPLDAIECKSTIQTLKLFMNREITTHRRYHFISEFKMFKNLNRIDVCVKSKPVEQLEIKCEFILELLNNLPVTHLTLSTNETLKNVYQFIDSAPNLKTLNVTDVKMKHLPVEMRKIFDAIKRCRTKQMTNELFHCIVNQQQYYELQVLKNVHSILRTTIAPSENINVTI